MTKNKKIITGLVSLAVLALILFFASGDLFQGRLVPRVQPQEETTEKEKVKLTEIKNLDLKYPESFIKLAKENIIDYDNQDPLKAVNRAEFVTIINRSKGVDTPSKGGCFPDVKGKWYEGHVCYAYQNDIIQGYDDGTFKPNKTINLSEAAKILSLTYNLELGDGKDVWYQKYIEALEKVNAIPITMHNTYLHIDKEHLVEIVWRLIYDKTEQPSLSFKDLKVKDKLVKASTDLVCGPIKDFIDEYGVVKYYNRKISTNSAEFDSEVKSILMGWGYRNVEEYKDDLKEYSNVDSAVNKYTKEECGADLDDYPIHF